MTTFWLWPVEVLPGLVVALEDIYQLCRNCRPAREAPAVVGELGA